MSTVFLPEYLEPMAHRFAEDYVEEVQGKKKGNPGYDTAYQKAFNSFCTDYVESCRGIQKNNPSSQTAAGAFRYFESEKNGLIPYIKESFPSEQSDALVNRLKISIIHLVNIYMAADPRLKNLKIKRASANLDSMYEYQRKSSKKEETLTQMSQANRERYARMILVSMLMSAIDHVFDQHFDQLELMVDRAFSKKIPSTMTDVNINNAFAQAFHDSFKQVFSSARLDVGGDNGVRKFRALVS